MRGRTSGDMILRSRERDVDQRIGQGTGLDLASWIWRQRPAPIQHHTPYTLHVQTLQLIARHLLHLICHLLYVSTGERVSG